MAGKLDDTVYHGCNLFITFYDNSKFKDSQMNIPAEYLLRFSNEYQPSFRPLGFHAISLPLGTQGLNII